MILLAPYLTFAVIAVYCVLFVEIGFVWSSLLLPLALLPMFRCRKLGTYALSEVLIKSRELYAGLYAASAKVTFSKASVKIRDMLRYWITLIRSSVFGIVIGAVPGTGGRHRGHAGLHGGTPRLRHA